MKYYKFGLLVFFTLLFTIGGKAVTLVGMYKRGEITLVEDPSFGKNTDWETLLYNYGKEFTIGPDGSIYVAHGQQHFISKFNMNGNFVRNFMQAGQGPLDCFLPHDLSILDDKYLVVVDFVEYRKITLVDLDHIDTKHVIVLKTNQIPWKVIALKGNKIAYLSRKFKTISKWEQKRIHQVILKNTVTGNEAVVATYEYNYKSRSTGAIYYIVHDRVWFWDVYIARSNDGNLIVGASDRPTLDIISTEGKKIKTINLNLPVIKMTNEDKSVIDKIANSRRIKTSSGYTMDSEFKNIILASSFFGDHFPYYKAIATDSIGNILVFPNDQCRKDCDFKFQVYSPEGKYICTTKINPGKFKLEFTRFGLYTIAFTDKGIFGIWDLKDAEDIYLRIVKVKIQ